MANEKEIANLLKESLIIVDELATIEIGYAADDYDRDGLEELIEKAKKLTKHRLWKLK